MANTKTVLPGLFGTLNMCVYALSFIFPSNEKERNLFFTLGYGWSSRFLYLRYCDCWCCFYYCVTCRTRTRNNIISKAQQFRHYATKLNIPNQLSSIYFFYLYSLVSYSRINSIAHSNLILSHVCCISHVYGVVISHLILPSNNLFEEKAHRFCIESSFSQLKTAVAVER